MVRNVARFLLLHHHHRHRRDCHQSKKWFEKM
jgi:hypothetical protein